MHKEMNLIVKGRHIEVTPALRERIEKKLSAIERKFDHIHKADVELVYESGKPNSQNECEMTIFADHVIFRAHAEHDDMYVAIDDAVKKIERQINKYKGKAYASENKHNRAAAGEKQPEPRVVKRKNFQIGRLNVDRALEQMEFLGHDFFIFINAENDAVSVLYRRKDGKYGLIETDITLG